MNNGNDRYPTHHNRPTSEPFDPGSRQQLDRQVDGQADRQVDVQADPQVDETTDEQINQLLHALASAPPPPGMEARILQSLDLQQAALTAAVPSRLYTALRVATHPIPLSLVTLSAAIILAAVFFTHRPHPETTHTSPVAAISTAKPLTVQENSVTQVPSPRPLGKTANAATASLRPTFVPAITRGQPQPASIPNDFEALAVSEMNAPSMLAPPLPLTPQEKLLLHMSRQNRDPQQIFNGDLRAQQDARQTDEFLTFFGKPIPPPQDAE